MASEIHVNDVGTRFSMTVQETGSGVDISNNSSITVYIKKPDDEVITRSGILLGDGTDGKFHYDTIAGDLDEAGHYKLQAKISLPSGTYYTDIYNFKTHCNL
mgnify:FL=1|tara:strand:- start:195 stop:500 length:306 start_codon:yes stop_codon:yes gene_type:complete